MLSPKEEVIAAAARDAGGNTTTLALSHLYAALQAGVSIPPEAERIARMEALVAARRSWLGADPRLDRDYMRHVAAIPSLATAHVGSVATVEWLWRKNRIESLMGDPAWQKGEWFFGFAEEHWLDFEHDALGKPTAVSLRDSAEGERSDG